MATRARACIRLLGFLILVLAATGCGVALVKAPVVPPPGLLFSTYKAPLQVDLENTTLGSKYGKASTSYFHDPILTGMSFAWNDAAIAEAARNGDIEQIRHVDYELMSILGIYARFTVHAYGD